MNGRSYFPILTAAHAPAVTAGMIDIAPNFVVPLSALKSAFVIVPAAGVPGTVTFTFSGTYAVGDEIRVTITSNITGRQLWRKSYLHKVQAGAATLALIADAVAALIVADVYVNSPYASVVSDGISMVTVTQLDDDKNGLVAYDYTNSAAGIITGGGVATTISEGYPADLVDKGVEAADITLATYDTVRIVFNYEVAIPFIDSAGVTAKEIYWYGTAGLGAAFVALIP